ncbi:MAG: pyridoxamine 5'-phosphate oxidase family protein [Bacteroidota bacterium]
MSLFSYLFVLIIGFSNTQKINNDNIPDCHTGATEIVPFIQPDATTGASPMYYDSLPKSELFEIIKKSKEAHVLSTVNADGIPNAAYMGPSVVDDNTLLFYISPDALTRKNIDRTGYAMFSFYIDAENGKTWKDLYRGGRMLLYKIFDQTEIDNLKKKVNINKEYENDVVFMKIIKIIPFS